MSTFRVSSMPDAGEFADGDAAALAWDILQRTAAHDLPATLDLTHCAHLKPYSIACLCALGELARRNGKPITAIPPKDNACLEHLGRIGLPEFFDGEWSKGNARDTNITARCVAWPPGNEGERIVEVLAPRAQLSAGMFATMVDCLDEIIRNALTHADSLVDCIVVGQAFEKSSKVEIAVLDLGRTIRGHLVTNPKHAHISSDEQAIRMACIDGVSGTPDAQLNRHGEPNSGAGLAYLRDYCESGGGQATILSGTAWTTYSGECEPVIGHLYRPFQGCLVNIRYFTERNLPSQPVHSIL